MRKTILGHDSQPATSSSNEWYGAEAIAGPQGSTDELEDYRVNLDGVVVLELAIIPDIGNGGVHASLDRLRDRLVLER